MNPLLRLRDVGQSVWLDLLRRSLIRGGGLQAADGAGVGERHADRCGSTDRAAVEPLATRGADRSC
jgi:hypothetical protein